jgi:hypothetical protein
VICGLLRKDPGERLDAADTERMLRLAIMSDPPAATAARRRRPKAIVAALAGSATLAVAAMTATAVMLERPGPVPPQATASAAPSTGPSFQAASPAPSAASSRQPAAPAPVTYLTPRTPTGPSVHVVSSASSQAKVKPGKAVPPGHSAKPAEPGKGNGKGKAHKHTG